MSKEPLARIRLISEKITYIEEIIEHAGSISEALADAAMYRAAILMHLTAIAEQFNKLQREGNTEILAYFDEDDIKGMYDTRTYIAHDYDGVNLAIIDWIVRHGLSKLKGQCDILLG